MATRPTAIRDVRPELSASETKTVIRRLGREIKLECINADRNGDVLNKNQRAHINTYNRIIRRLNDALEAAGYERFERERS